jgi:hypothetical protein
MLRIRHLKIHNFKNASARRYLSYYNSDNKNNEENYTNPANVITPSVPNNLQTRETLVSRAVEPLVSPDKLSRIENKIEWIIVFTIPTWVWTIGMSLYNLLH